MFNFNLMFNKYLLIFNKRTQIFTHQIMIDYVLRVLDSWPN